MKVKVAAMEKEILLLREAVEDAARLHVSDVENGAKKRARDNVSADSRQQIKHGRSALAFSEAAVKVGQSDLVASEVALALSRAEVKVGQADLLASEVALAASQAETKLGQTDLLASEAALASSRAQTQIGLADLLASAVALASSQEETKTGLANMLASAVALAASRAETKGGLADLVASAAALTSSRAQTKVGQTNLLASEVANKALTLANDLLVTNEAVLERLVEKRTAALTREVEERRRAEDSMRQGEKLQAIGQLTGGIAHDFNNILQLVFSGAALLRRPGLTDERRLFLLDKIDHAVGRAGELTSRLLAFARKQPLRPEACDLNALLTGMTELLRPLLGSMIKLETDLAPDLWWVIADPSQLEVAILNLAVNARDAMPEGGVFSLQSANVMLEAMAERAGGDYVCLTVKDTGHGMQPAVLARVFEPFFTTKPPGKGTGLGLAQVWGFAGQSGGDVTVKSDPGKGTAFFFHLPRPMAEALATAAVALTKDVADDDYVARAVERTVLLVEDNSDLASFTLSILEAQGYATLYAANAADALALLDAGTVVDAVFSDVVMPGSMNGLELAATVRERFPRIAVLLASGYSEFLTKRTDQTLPEVLSKPYRLEDLTAALGRAFTKVTANS